MGKYAFESRVRYSEIAEDEKLSLSGIIDYFQDCSTFQSEDLGIGLSWLTEHHLVWLMARWQVVIKRRPHFGEKIRISTWPYKFQLAFGSRNFFIESEDGELLAYADSLWVYMDSEKGEPARVGEYEGNLYAPLPPFDMNYAPRKIRPPKVTPVTAVTFAVTHSHLDSNHHVNNGQYLKMAENYLPEDFTVGEFRIEYKKSAVLGDHITPMIYDAGDEFFVDLTDGAGTTFAITHFIRQ